MTRNKELKFGEIGDLSLDEPAQGHRPVSTGSQQRSNQAPRPAVVASKASSTLWIWSTLLLAVVVLVLATFFYRQVSILQARLDNTLTDSSAQLGSLASQLSATDESLNQSSEQVADTLKFHDSEIRKLWAVSNERNKKLIQSNQSAVNALKKERVGAAKTVASLRTELSALDGRLAQYVIAGNQLQTQLDLINESVKQQGVLLSQQKKMVQPLSAALPELQKLAQLQASGDGLGSRMVETEAAINAFDAYRREVNVRLDKLDARLP